MAEQEEPLNLNDVLGAVYEMFLPDAKAKGLEFRYVQTSLTSDIDPLALMRIVSNLVSNAVKYTPNGKILLGVRRRPSEFRIEVHDTGLGMSQQEFEIAKQRHVRLHGKESMAEGHGFGLAIASELASESNFDLYVLPRGEIGTSMALEPRNKSKK